MNNKCFSRVNIIGVGPSKHATKAKIIVWYINDTVFSMKCHQYEVDVPVILFRGNIRNIYHWKGVSDDFFINKEGIFNTKNDPNLAIECEPL